MSFQNESQMRNQVNNFFNATFERLNDLRINASCGAVAIDYFISDPPEYCPKPKDIIRKAQSLHVKLNATSKDKADVFCSDCEGSGLSCWVSGDLSYRGVFICSCSHGTGKVRRVTDDTGKVIVEYQDPPAGYLKYYSEAHVKLINLSNSLHSNKERL